MFVGASLYPAETERKGSRLCMDTAKKERHLHVLRHEHVICVVDMFLVYRRNSELLLFCIATEERNMRRMLGNVLGSKPAVIVLVDSGAEREKNDD